MINRKDQKQNASEYDFFFDWDAFSKSDEMEVFTPESTSTSFSLHEPSSLHIPTEELIPKYYMSGSISPVLSSAGYEALQLGYDCVSGNSPTQMPFSTSYGIQSSDGRPELLNQISGHDDQLHFTPQDSGLHVEHVPLQIIEHNKNVWPSSQTQSPTSYAGQHSDDRFEFQNQISGQGDQFHFTSRDSGPLAEHIPFRPTDQNENVWPSSQARSPLFHFEHFPSEPLTIRQSPAREPWCHLEISYDDINQVHNGIAPDLNYEPQALDECPDQHFLVLTDPLSAARSNHASPSYNAGVRQASYHTQNNNNIDIQRRNFTNAYTGMPFAQITNPQSNTGQFLSDIGNCNKEFLHVPQQSLAPVADPAIDSTAVSFRLREGKHIVLPGSETIFSSPLPSQPISANQSDHPPLEWTSEGTSPSSSLSSMRCEDGRKSSGGGRKPGSKLKQKSKSNAHLVRTIGSCWRCSLRRDRCGEGSPCPRCLDKPISGSSLRGIECTRVKLRDLGFIPVLLSKMNGFRRVAEFRNTHMKGRTGRSYIIPLSVGRDLETFDCELHEFIPKDDKSRSYINYYSNFSGSGMAAEMKISANLELASVSESDQPRYSRYLDRLLESSLRGKSDFARTCYAGENSKFAENLLMILFETCQQIEVQALEKSALRNYFKLIISTYIVSRNITFKENITTASPTVQSSRMANKQFKYFFFSIMTSQYQDMLNEMQQQLRHSCNIEQVTSLVYAILCLAMGLDILLRYIYLTADHLKTQNSSSWGCTGDDVVQEAESFGLNIESGFDFIIRIFQAKFKKMNPFENPRSTLWIGKLKSAEIMMFCRIDQLIKDNSEYLKTRQSTRLSTRNLSLYTSRLVSKFLLSMQPLI